MWRWAPFPIRDGASARPDSVAYSVSQDGQTWKELGTVTYAQAEISPGSANGFETVEYVLKLDAAEKARYIRAEFGHGLDASKDRRALYMAGRGRIHGKRHGAAGFGRGHRLPWVP